MEIRRSATQSRVKGKKLLQVLQDAGLNDVAAAQEIFIEMVSPVLPEGGVLNGQNRG
ncbi:hypothetical protein ASZ90_018560 [hydrocarbon metagenome]|uniref:Uncharacterized protein n=1 Tax=hydrocarbon metagenome TaxID=938273 RepID=A0A0W8E5Y4_9ZZZZ